MHTVIIVIHLMVVLSLVAVVLLQRSEGGALGIGGGGGFMSSRGQANALTRATTILAIVFFATSLGLAFLNKTERGTGGSLFEQPGATSPLAPTGGEGGLLPFLRGSQDAQPPAADGAQPQPSTQAPPAGAAPQPPAAPQAPVSQ